jgi:hypothetical protein
MRLYLAAYQATDGITFEAYPVLPRTDVPPLEGTVESLATVTGWPFQVVQHEAQLTARYEMLVYAAVVVVRAPSAATIAAHRTEVFSLLSSARVDLTSDTPAAISELWDVR